MNEKLTKNYMIKYFILKFIEKFVCVQWKYHFRNAICPNSSEEMENTRNHLLQGSRIGIVCLIKSWKYDFRCTFTCPKAKGHKHKGIGEMRKNLSAFSLQDPLVLYVQNSFNNDLWASSLYKNDYQSFGVRLVKGMWLWVVVVVEAAGAFIKEVHNIETCNHKINCRNVGGGGGKEEKRAAFSSF